MRLLIPTFMVTLSPTHPERTEAIRLWYAVRETLSPTRPERTEAIRLWYAVRETQSPTRPERAEAHSPGHRPGLFGAVTCRPVR